MSGYTPSRRDFLSILGATSLVGLSGCSESSPDSSPTSTLKATEVATVTNSPSPSPTPVDDVAPSILSHEAAPEDFGTRLGVSLQGEDNQNIAYAAISYGDRVIEEEPGRPEVELTGVLEDVPDAQPTFPGMVVYVLRDAAGNETEKTAYVDQEAPELSVDSSTPETAGELNLVMVGEDNVGLHALRMELEGGTVVENDVTGQKEVSLQKRYTADQYDSVMPGEMNTIRAELQDAMGNSTSKEFEQYVRKYDVHEEPRLSLGTVYQPYFGFKDKVAEQCRDERIPTIGRYERPLPYEVFNRHIDQMTGHGINRVMIEFLGNETGKHDKRFLEADLIDDIQIEPFYTAAQNLWKKGYWSTVESYRDDLVRPHMTFMRDHILSKDNVTRLNGRPVIQMWNSVNWAQDYEYNRIVEEWGGYDAFFDEIRSLLSVNGTEPFFVGGTNWWGHGGYPGGRKAELTKHFDATTTWMVGAELHDGFTSQETALEWVEENWRGHRDFTDQHDMDFVPMVFPGFNERTPDAGNCDPRDNSGEGRLVPRSPDFFREMLKLADEYRTTELINNSVYNNWQEGTHIEPGIFEPGPFGEKDYGTAYLDVIADFQRT